MEPSLTPPGKVIHILLYATSAIPSQILPEGFTERVESEVGRSGKEGTSVVLAKGQRKTTYKGLLRDGRAWGS